MPRPLGAVLIYLVLAALFLGIGWLLLTPLVAQINAFIRDLPHYLAQAQKWAEEAQQALAANDPLSAVIDGLAAQLTTSLQSALPDLLRFPLTLLSGAFGILLSVVIVITRTASRETSIVRYACSLATSRALSSPVASRCQRGTTAPVPSFVEPVSAEDDPAAPPKLMNRSSRTKSPRPA